MIKRDIYNKLQQFVPINGNNSVKNSIGFLVSKNWNDTGCFIKVNNERNLLQNNNIINTNINNFKFKEDNQINHIQNINKNKIRLIPIKKKWWYNKWRSFEKWVNKK